MSQRELLLLRHANAEAQGAGQSDFDRPLSRLGCEQSAAVANWLKNQPRPQLTLCSPSLRTQQTLAVLEERLGPLHARMEPAIYEASPGTLLALLDGALAAEGIDRVLLVGHNPGLESAVALLSDGRSNNARGMPTAAIAHLRLEDGSAIEPGSAELVSFWSPGT